MAYKLQGVRLWKPKSVLFIVDSLESRRVPGTQEVLQQAHGSVCGPWSPTAQVRLPDPGDSHLWAFFILRPSSQAQDHTGS